MKINKAKCFLNCSIVFVISFSTVQSIAQDIPQDSLAKFYEMTLSQLESLKGTTNSSELEKVINSLLTVASQKALSSRESPSIVSLITEEEIKQSGARDLIDILRNVPGFDFAFDGEANIGVGVRGNWANEGKVLLLIDGQLMNQIFSGSLSFGNHYSVSSISRIEIIRGPGSAIYGGFAEFGVINVVTKTGKEIDGAKLTANYGQMKGSYGRRTLDLSIGKKVKESEFSLSTFLGQGNRSSGVSFVASIPSFSRQKIGSFSSMANNSTANPRFLELKFKRKSFQASALYDGYETTLLNIADQNGERFINQKNNNLNLSIQNEIHLSKKLLFTPQLSFVYQAPRISGVPDSLKIQQNYGTRLNGNLNTIYTLNRKFNIAGGVQVFYDHGTNSDDSIQTVSGFVKSIDYTNIAAYLQVTAKTSFANLIIGGRYDHNSSYGDAFVPRFAITKKINKFHLKALYSSSFRAPTIENIARGITNTNTLESGIKPEVTTVLELEGGYQIGKNALIQVNLFQSTVKDPIVSLGIVELYTNFDKTASRGVEAEFLYKRGNVSFSTNYSFYSVKNLEKVDIYSANTFTSSDSLLPTGTNADDAVMLAFPTHKIVTKLTYNLMKRLSIHSNIVYTSQKYSYNFEQGSASLYKLNLAKIDNNVTANFFVNYAGLLKKLDIGIGLYNAFDSDYRFATPSYDGSGSIPGLNREWLLRVVLKL